MNQVLDLELGRPIPLKVSSTKTTDTLDSTGFEKVVSRPLQVNFVKTGICRERFNSSLLVQGRLVTIHPGYRFE
jgi:hypothetical protein